MTVNQLHNLLSKLRINGHGDLEIVVPNYNNTEHRVGVTMRECDEDNLFISKGKLILGGVENTVAVSAKAYLE